MFKDFFTVTHGETENGIMTLGALFRRVQSAADAHNSLLGASGDRLSARGLLWMVTGHCAELARLPAEGESVRVETWTGARIYVFSPRYCRLSDAAGGTLASVTSSWLTVGAADRRAKLSAERCSLLPAEPMAYPCPEPQRFFCHETQPVGGFTVPPEYIDGNGHMNNARYFDLAERYLPPELRELTPKKVQIEYHKELLCGETVDIRRCLGPASVYLEGRTPKLSFKMSIAY